jgi:hypothetical protein
MLRALAEGKVEPHPAGAAGHLIDRGDHFKNSSRTRHEIKPQVNAYMFKTTKHIL